MVIMNNKILNLHDTYIKTWNVQVNQKLTFFRSCTKFSYKKPKLTIDPI